MRILNAVCFDISVHHGINGESGHRLDAQFLGDILPVTDNCGKANAQLFSDFLIDKTLGDELQDLDFTSRKVVCICDFRLRMLASVMSMLVHPQDRLDQVLLVLVDVQGRHTRELG